MTPKREQRYTILIADDAEINRDLLRAILEDTYDVIEAEDGEQAVTILQQREHEISLLDFNMPHKDGFGVLDDMQKYNWIDSVPVIMITAENDSTLLKQAYDMGVIDFIRRPFNIETVRRRTINTIMIYAKQRRLAAIVNDQISQNENVRNLMNSILTHIQ